MKTATKSIMSVVGALWFPIYFVILLCIDLAFRYIYFTDESISILSFTPILFSVFWSLALCGLLYMLPAKARGVCLVLLTVVLSVLCVVHAVMYNLFGTFFSFADLAYAEVGAKFFSFSYIIVRWLLLACLLLAVAGSVVLSLYMPTSAYRPRRFFTALIIIVVSAAAILLLDGRLEGKTSQELTWSNTAAAISDADAYHNLSNTNRALSASGIYQFTCRSLVSALGLDAEANETLWAELDGYYADSEKQTHPDNSMSGIYAGKNLIMITMESIDTWMVTPEYMPNLYSLRQNGLNFASHYTPLYISAGTFCTEFVSNTGVIPPSTGIDVSVYEANSFPYSLANLFNAAGYTSNSFHAASPTIYNRGNVHVNLGFTKYHSFEEMGMDNYMLDSQMVNGYDLMVSDDGFFSFILTISAHGPYTDDTWYAAAEPHMDAARAAVDVDALPSSCTDTEEYIRAVAQAMETDEMIGKLIEKLEADGHIDDTVLVLFGDHYSKYITNHDFLMDLKGVGNSDMLCNTPLVIYSKGSPAMTVEKVTSSADIAPTLANLFALETNYAYYAGNDAFGDGGGYVVFTGNNWYDGDIYYSSAYSGEMSEYVFNMNSKVSADMDAAWNTLRSDYFSHLQ